VIRRGAEIPTHVHAIPKAIARRDAIAIRIVPYPAFVTWIAFATNPVPVMMTAFAPAMTISTPAIPIVSATRIVPFLAAPVTKRPRAIQTVPVTMTV
jgi:hypothetical protein